MHACPAGCGAQVQSHMFACTNDWYRLPKEIRDAIWRGYRREPLGEAHTAAMVAGDEWYRDHPRSEPAQAPPRVGFATPPDRGRRGL